MLAPQRIVDSYTSLSSERNDTRTNVVGPLQEHLGLYVTYYCVCGGGGEYILMQCHLPTQKQLENEAARDISDAYSNLSNICARHPMSHTRPVAEYTVRASYFEKKKR